MSLVYAGICCHAPGITARSNLAEPELYARLVAAFDQQRQAIEDAGAEALMLVSSEHFANFFMNNMPAYAIGMADSYEGPIEDPRWLKINPVTIPANPALSLRIINEVLQSVDVSYAQEWKFDHGMAVPLHFLTPRYDLPVIPVNINCQAPPLSPLQRTWAFGKALRAAIDKVPERIALISTGGTSHWPCTPDSGKINVAWDREFLARVLNTRKDELLSYADAETYAHAGQGAFEMRTSICVAAACEGAKGKIVFFEPIPVFATTCIIASF
jgi:aromatic ring-opening dioxygenase catalytic subunit (LigB family)